VVDLVVEPGSISCPDSSINGQLLSKVPSPFKTSCTVGSGNYTTPVTAWNQKIADERRNMIIANSQYSGTQPTITSNSKYSDNSSILLANNPILLIVSRCSVVEGNSVQVASKEGLLPKCGPITQNGNCNGISMLDVSVQLKAVDISPENGSKENIPGATLPKCLSIEPSFAADWLEISWEELELKERVGAGTSLTLGFLLAYCVL